MSSYCVWLDRNNKGKSRGIFYYKKLTPIDNLSVPSLAPFPSFPSASLQFWVRRSENDKARIYKNVYSKTILIFFTLLHSCLPFTSPFYLSFTAFFQPAFHFLLLISPLFISVFIFLSTKPFLVVLLLTGSTFNF